MGCGVRGGSGKLDACGVCINVRRASLRRCEDCPTGGDCSVAPAPTTILKNNIPLPMHKADSGVEARNVTIDEIQEVNQWPPPLECGNPRRHDQGQAWKRCCTLCGGTEHAAGPLGYLRAPGCRLSRPAISFSTGVVAIVTPIRWGGGSPSFIHCQDCGRGRVVKARTSRTLLMLESLPTAVLTCHVMP